MPRGRSAPASNADAEGTVWRTSCVCESQSQATFDVRAFEQLFRKPRSSNAASASDAGGDGDMGAARGRGAGERERRASLVHDDVELVLFDQLDAAPGDEAGGEGHTSRDEGGLSRAHSKRRGQSLVRSPVRSLIALSRSLVVYVILLQDFGYYSIKILYMIITNIVQIMYS